MPPPLPGLFAYTDDPYSLDNIPPNASSSSNSRRKSRVNAIQQQQQYLTGQPQRGHVIHNGGSGPVMVDGGPMDHLPHQIQGHQQQAFERQVNPNAKIIRGGNGASSSSRGPNNNYRNGVAEPSQPTGVTTSSRSAARAAQAQMQAQHAQEREMSPDPVPLPPPANTNTTNGNLLKRKREMQDRMLKYAKDRYDRRDDIYASSLNSLTHHAHQLHQNPSDSPGYVLRLYPIALERSASLHAISEEELHSLMTTKMLFNHEMKQIEDDFDRSKTRLLERVMEGLEERRRRAREEKEGEGVVPVESSLEVTQTALARSSTSSSHPAAPFTLSALIPFGLNPDDLTSPFPLSLTSLPSSSSSHHPGPRKQRAGHGRGGKEAMMNGTSALALGKAIAQLGGCKEVDVDHDLGDIRRAQKRRRAAVRAAGGA